MTEPLRTGHFDWTLVLLALSLLGLSIWAYRVWRRVQMSLRLPNGYRSRVGLPMWKRKL